MRSDRYYVQYIRGSISWVASGISRFFQARVVRRMHQYGPGTSWADSRFHFLYVSGGGMNCVSCDICVYHLWFVCVFSAGVFLSSRVTEACPVTTDLIMLVYVRTSMICSNEGLRAR